MGVTGRFRERWVGWTAALVGVAALYAAAVALTGGFKINVGGVRFSSHSWERPAIVAAAGSILLAIAARSRIAALSRRVGLAIDAVSVSRVVVAAAVASALASGIGFGTFANGGADSYGYVGQARLFADGKLTDTIPISPEYPWPDVDYTLTPLGFTKGQRAGVIAPMYPPGLPLLLAPMFAVSEKAVYVVVPLFGALLIWLTYRFGDLNGDRTAGALAALLLSFSPTFLYQVVQPMSDVPCAACWLAALLLATRGSTAGSTASGVLSSLAILIRPNLAPLAAIVVALAIVSHPFGRLRRAAYFVVALAPGIVLLCWIQAVRYGAPFASGYGTAPGMFSLEYVVPNLALDHAKPYTVHLVVARRATLDSEAGTESPPRLGGTDALGSGVGRVSALHVFSTERMVLHAVSSTGHSHHALFCVRMRACDRAPLVNGVASACGGGPDHRARCRLDLVCRA
jgi:dolichyl-phosphate-mannose-protein mannosyltransferase